MIDHPGTYQHVDQTDITILVIGRAAIRGIVSVYMCCIAL